MEFKLKSLLTFSVFYFLHNCDSAKINTPRVLLPWFENVYVNYTFEIIEGGCYTWTLSRDDIIDLEPLYEDFGGHCSRSARVSVSKTCIPPGSVIILAEEVNTGEIIRGDVDVDKIKSINVTSTTWKLYLEEAPEAFVVVAYDDQGSKFSTLEGVSFVWEVDNSGDEALIVPVRWKDTDYEAPRGVSDLEAQGLQSYSVLLYGQAIGESRVTVCLVDICSDFKLKVVASVVLTPATAQIAPGDTLRYRVVRAHAGRLTVQDIADTLYHIKVSKTDIALLEDTVSLVRGTNIGTSNVYLYSGATEVAMATLNVVEPYSIKVSIRPSNLLIRGEEFIIHCIVLDENGHAMLAGDEMLIRLSVVGEADVELLRSTENGTITYAVAHSAGPLTVTANLHSIARRTLSKTVQGEVSAVAVEPLQVLPPELYIAWTDVIQEVPLKHQGGGDWPVTWSTSETTHSAFLIAPTGVVTVRGVGDIEVTVHLSHYPHVKATGRIISVPMELVQVSSSGHARVGRMHPLHVALTATHPDTGELYHFHVCNCASFSVTLLEGPEPHNVTAAPWIQPVDGACCVLTCAWVSRGVSHVRVAWGRAGDTARVAVRAAPHLLWPPPQSAVLLSASIPILAEGEALSASSSDTRLAEVAARPGPPPTHHPDVQLFTLTCRKKGDARVELVSEWEDVKEESVALQSSCTAHVSRVRLDPPDDTVNCSSRPKLWLRPGQEVALRVTLLDVIGRELLDENGPRVWWETEPKHKGIHYGSTDKLYVETHPDFVPVPVPYKYYQLITADESTIGWSGSIKASIPDATASIQARVVAPLAVEPLKVNIAWEGEKLSDIASVSGGSGSYAVVSPAGVTAAVEGGALHALAPAPGTYDLLVTDLCVPGDQHTVEVHIEEVLTVEVSAPRAVMVGGCVTVAAVARGVAGRRLEVRAGKWRWRSTGPVERRGGEGGAALCGLAEGTATLRAAYGNVWSSDVQILVFPPLQIVPERARLPPGARLQLRHYGGPPSHLAALHYRAVSGTNHAEVSASGSLHGISVGQARVRLVATNINNVEMASAESQVEVIPISDIRVRASTQTLLVGAPCPLWVEAGGLPPSALSALHPPPRVTWTVRDPAAARLYTTHVDDLLDRSVAEGLTVRVVPLKAGVITIDVRVRNMGQVAETGSWDSAIEILGISDIITSVEGSPEDMSPGERLALAVGATIRLKSSPRSHWIAYGDGSFEVSSNGEIKALKPGTGVVMAQHKDDRNNIFRETALHVEVCVPVYCTAHPSVEEPDAAVRVAMRNALGRELLAPHANISSVPPLLMLPAHAHYTAFGQSLAISDMDASGALFSIEGSVSGVTLTDEVWLVGSDSTAGKHLVTGGWSVCLDGVGWAAPSGVALHTGSGVTLAVLVRDEAARHTLRLDRPPTVYTLHQVPVDKMEFLPGAWPSVMVPLSISAAGVSDGPLLCTEEERYALEGIQPELPYTCRTNAPHTAAPLLDIPNGQLGCSIRPAGTVMEASEVELCAEWGISKTCTKVMLLPLVQLSQTKVSLLQPPATFTVTGHPHALNLVKLTTTPGLKIDVNHRQGEIDVVVTSENSVCGFGWVDVVSRLTAQQLRVEVERECDVSCGTLLGAIFSLLKPYMSTLMTAVAVAAFCFFVQGKFSQNSMIKLPSDPSQSVLPPMESPPLLRTRTWSRSPYASSGPAAPVYGDTSMLPDNSYSPNSSQLNPRFL